MKYLVLTVWVITIVTLNGQTYWSKQIDSDCKRYDYFRKLSLLPSGNIAVSGGANQVLPFYDSNIFYIEIAPTGQVVYKKTRDIGLGNGLNMISVNDSIYIIEGTHTTFSNAFYNNTDQFYLTINAVTGDSLGLKVYGDSLIVESSGQMIRTKDNGIALTGWSFPIDNSERSKVLFTKQDSVGNELFRKTFTNNVNRNFESGALIERPDSGFILLAGSVYDSANVNSYQDLFIVGTDKYGVEQWRKRFAPTTKPLRLGIGASGIAKRDDGNYITFGLEDYSPPVAADYLRYLFMVITPTGQIIDSVGYGHNKYCSAVPAVRTSDGNYLCTGFEVAIDSSHQYGMIMKLSPDLKIIWKRLYRTSPPESNIHDWFRDAVEMPDKGFVVCGRAYGPLEDSTFQNGWVIRVDSLGCLAPGCDTTISTTAPIPDVVAGITVFPNPTSDEVTVETEEIMLGYRLVDMSGRVLQDVQYLRQAGVRAFSVSLAEEAAGVYLLAVHTERGWLVKKVVKT